MKSLFKTLIATTLFASAFAAQSTSQPASKQAAPAPMMDPNPSARWGTNDSGNFFATGEVVWFKPLNDIQTKSTTTAATDGADLTNVTDVTSKWAPAFRLAIGYNTSYDGWDSVLTYTELQYKHNSPYVFSDSTFGNIKDLFANFNYTGSRSVRYYYYQGDLDFGRMFKVSSKLFLRPHVGVRSLWLSQKTSVSSTNSLTSFLAAPAVSASQSLHGTLVGAEFGLDTQWMLSKEFSVYANAGAATLVYGRRFSFTFKKGASLDTLSRAENTKVHYISKIVQGIDFAIGLRWDKNIYDGDYHIGINFGYEHHNLVNLPINDSYGLSQDFTLQGLALGARFDF